MRKEPLTPFAIKKIGFPSLLKAFKRMKGKRLCGVGVIYPYSLKLVAPLLEDALLHLINPSIEKECLPRNGNHSLSSQNNKKKDRNMFENNKNLAKNKGKYQIIFSHSYKIRNKYSKKLKLFLDKH